MNVYTLSAKEPVLPETSIFILFCELISTLAEYYGPGCFSILWALFDKKEFLSGGFSVVAIWHFAANFHKTKALQPLLPV